MKKFEDRIIYQIYPLSFKDSNNDGYGDIPGIISKLDYLKDLGVGILWLSPIYKSPLNDNGYDISSYLEINPLFGTMDDLKTLIEEAKKRDIYIVLDLVINHTSTEHEWFKEALNDKNSKYRDYYFFKEGKGNKPPNKWTSAFSGSTWEKVENEDNMYYLHLFDKTQADLNYKNEELIKEIENIIKFYLDLGVYGFRCDVINRIYKTSFDNGRFNFYGRGSEYYMNQEGCFKVLERIRKEVLDNYDTFLVGETFDITPSIAKEFIDRRCLDMMFEFEHSFSDQYKFIPIFKKKFKVKNLVDPIFKYQENVSWMANYLENHDQRRSVSRYGDIKKYYKLSSKALCMFLLTLRGTPFIYQGEEIGMTDYSDLKLNETNDCSALNVTKTASKILKIKEEKAFKLINETINRDHARSPFQWNKETNSGFNDGEKPWLKMNTNYKEGINVEDELKYKDSILNFYKEMISIRNNSRVLKEGTIKRLKSNKNIVKFIRELDNEKYLIVINLSSKRIKDIREDNEVIISNYYNHSLNYLYPYEGIIYKVK